MFQPREGKSKICTNAEQLMGYELQDMHEPTKLMTDTF
jgi:hypothetical protein